MAAVKTKLIKNFFTREELKVLQKYCYDKLDKIETTNLNDWDPKVFSPSWYDDSLMNSLLQYKLPIVEKKSNLKLFPTYAYWRYYVFGATLSEHLDRPSCEISLSSCIKKYDNWPLTVEKKSFELEEGDAILYAGCDQKHGRPGVYKGEGMAQIFFHYVNKNGPHTKHAYDNYYKETGRQK